MDTNSDRDTYMPHTDLFNTLNVNSVYSSKYVLLSGDLRDNLNTLHSEMEYNNNNTYNIIENENDDGTLSIGNTQGTIVEERLQSIQSDPNYTVETINEDLNDVDVF